jgi:hypothetical protein
MKKPAKTPSMTHAPAGASLSSGFGMMKVNGKDMPADFDVATMLQADEASSQSTASVQCGADGHLGPARGIARRRKPIDL